MAFDASVGRQFGRPRQGSKAREAAESRDPGRARAAGRARRVAEPAGSDLARSIVDELSWYMSQHKVSRADLAQSMGVSPGRVSQILSGDENLTLRTLSSVCAALGADFGLTLRPASDGA
jgi:DNA-binding Xre family transcriptional regulator